MSARQGYGLMAVALAIVAALALVGMRVDGERNAGESDAPASTGPATEAGGTVAVTPTVPRASDTPASTAPALAVAPAEGCVLDAELREGASSEQVACLQAALAGAGILDHSEIDGTFGPATAEAVRRYQDTSGLRADGVVGRVTASALGIWVGPPPPDPSTCEPAGRSVVVDRDEQRAWFCDDGRIDRQFPLTSAWSQPDPGRYTVYAKDLQSSSTLTDVYSTMTHFVAFTHGKFSGARIAFHSVPKLADGSWAQPLDTVGALTQRGDSEGCIRLLPDDAVAVWDWLAIGDVVRVIT